METITSPGNQILGTFIFEEYEGKKYKMLVVEEVKKELSDWEIIEKAREHLERPYLQKIDTLALSTINQAIQEENEKNPSDTKDLWKYYWYYNENRNDIGLSIAQKASKIHSQIQIAANTSEVIDKVVEKLGTDIFRIAAGVERK
jgi:hypothetical protein